MEMEIEKSREMKDNYDQNRYGDDTSDDSLRVGQKNPNPLPSYFQVEIDDDESLFKDEIANVISPPCEAYTYTEAEAAHGVAMQMRYTLDNFWMHFENISEESKSQTFCHSVMRAAATVLYLVFTPDIFNNYSNNDSSERVESWRSQVNKLWEELCVLGKQDRPVSEVIRHIYSNKIKIKETDYVTESDVTDMVEMYAFGLEVSCYFDRPLKKFNPRLSKDPIFDDLLKVVREIKRPRFNADEYAYMLIEIVDENSVKYEDILSELFLQFIDFDSIKELDPRLLKSTWREYLDSELRCLSLRLSSLVRERIQRHMIKMCRPIIECTIAKCPSELSASDMSASVLELVQVAEIRRWALGNRFIGQNHFLWAFYECGYGLPANIRNAIKLSDVPATQPPFHVYLTAVKLVETFEETTLQLDHFVFAVLYTGDVFGSNKQVEKMKKAFNDFRRDITLDSRKRPKAPGQKLKKKSKETKPKELSDYLIGVYAMDALPPKEDDAVKNTSA